MRKRIHLTESQLYGLVEQTINELDWKTYMNAARKRSTQQRSDVRNKDYPSYVQHGRHVSDLTRAAEKAFAAKYDIDPRDQAFHFHYPVGGDVGLGTDGCYAGVGDNGFHSIDDYTQKRIPCATPTKGGDDILNYLNSRSRYTKGKGWNESMARRVTESVIRKLRESKNTDNIDRYEEALLGTSLLVESSNYPYLWQLNNISDVFIEIEGMRRGEVCISDRYGTGLTLTSQEVENLIEKGVVQGTRHGVVAWIRYPQQRAEIMERMYRLLKIYHPDLP